jgi:tetratricopeptide (TPR) repeat protein
MKLRIGIVLVGALTLGACAAGTGAGGGGGASGGVRSSGGAVDLAGVPEGEPIANNRNTQEAERQLNLALIAQGEAQRTAFQSALNSAQLAITADARNPLPWLQKGKAHMGLLQWMAADSALKKAEELRPVYIVEIRDVREKAWIDMYNQANGPISQNRFAEAVPILENASLIYDERPEIRVILGQIHFQLGNEATAPAEKTSHFEKAVENANRALATIRENAADFDSATVAVWREMEPDIPPLLAQSYLSLQRYDQAAATLRPLLDADPTNTDYARTQASIFTRMNQPDSARAVLQRLSRAAGASMTAQDHYVMAMMLYEMSDFPGAVTSLNSVLQAAPSNRDAIEWRTRALYEQVQDLQPAGGQPLTDARNQLIASAEAWIRLDPNNNYPYLLMAGQLQQAGQNERAAQIVQQYSALPFYTSNLELRPGRGSVAILGDVINKTMTAGQPLRLRFTFFGPGNANLGTRDVTVTLPVADAAAAIQVDFESTQPVEGYSYAVLP